MLDNIIKLYQASTGKTIPEHLLPIYKAWAQRAVFELENKLGWSLSGVSNVNVLGCSPNGCNCDIDASTLTEAPEQRGTYRFYSFENKQPYVMTDPFTKIHAVYLCRVEPEGPKIKSETGDVVILGNIKDFAPRYIDPKFGKFIKSCHEMTVCQQFCNNDCLNCTALLIDGDWATIDNLPDELVYLLCDYIDWMATGGPQNRGLRRESVDGHAVGYGDWRLIEPYYNPANAAIIQLYAGPYGMVDRKNIW